MAVRHLIERILWISTCPGCNVSSTSDTYKRSNYCTKCGIWTDYVETKSVSEEYKALQK